VSRAVLATAMLVAGGLIGAAVSIGLGRPRERDAPSKTASPPPPVQGSPNSGRKVDRLSLAQLTDRVVALEKRALTEQLDASAPLGEPLPGEMQVDPAVVKEETRLRHQRWRNAHGEERHDPEWSQNKATVFDGVLAERGRASGFTVLEVDCRTTWCRADLEWPSYAAALNTYSSALHVLVDGCESAVLLETPPDPTQRYRSSAFYNCEADRLQAR
jgi:hypothetical protein